jgi:cyclophilin family peptidyl-prolyl cis-trans isomerase
MAVALVTARGAFVIDLYLKSAPMCGFNFLKLAKLGWFSNALFIEIVPNCMIRVAQSWTELLSTSFLMLVR